MVFQAVIPKMSTAPSINHEYILTYAKIRRQEHRRLKDENFDVWFRLSSFAFYPIPLNEKRYSNPDNDDRGNWKADPFDAPNIRKNLTYIIKNPQTGVEFLPPTGRCWRTDEKKFKKLLSDNRIIFGTNGKSRPQLKVFYEEKKMLGEVETTWYEGNNKGTVTEATKELQKNFEKKIFSTPKPIRLIKSLLRIATNSDDIILDSFAGSGTTAHAVLDLNARDGGNRNFILIECEDYADNITAERIRRVIKGVPGAKDKKLKQGLGGGFSFYNLGAAIDMDEMLEGKNLPSYKDLAGYVFFTATGEKIKISQIDKKNYYIGSAKGIEIFLMYEPNKEKLKKLALNLDFAEKIAAKFPRNKKLIFSLATFLDEWSLSEFNIDFAQIPYAIYRYVE
ncbi:MAG: hypothetical protein JRJ49_02100 [Deltaproteobacteria bacterium]|nr:hypothetical protein [Deltaproteobacteria bacterium]